MKLLLPLLLSLMLVSCAFAQRDPNPPRVDLPSRVVLDTRFIAQIKIDTSVVQLAKRKMLAAMPNEMGLCLQGYIEPHEPYELRRTLVIFDALDPTSVSGQTDSTISFQCELRKYFVGTLHTHTHRVPEICRPSPLDMSVLLGQDEVIIIYILCSDGAVYTQLKDGRWNWFRWNGAGEIKNDDNGASLFHHKENDFANF